MLSTKETKSANFIRIIYVLKGLRDEGQISSEEYQKAKKFYQKFTGADIVISD